MKRQDIDLILVLNGKLSDRIRDICLLNDSIIVVSKLDYDVLIGMYKGALALLIPLRNTPQDCARYPQKITEYLASGRPIISCQFGEIGRHFSHGVDALLAVDFDVERYAEMMIFAVDNTDELEKIAFRGHVLGRKIFDVASQRENLKKLLA